MSDANPSLKPQPQTQKHPDTPYAALTVLLAGDT